MANNRKAIEQLNTMVIITLITQVFMLIKNAIIASHFGISTELDAFNLANNISTFVYSFIGAGISTVIIPFLKDKSNKKALDIFISVIYSTCFIILIMMLIFREQLIILVSGSLDIYFVSMSSKLFIFTVITGFLNSIIQLVNALMEFNGQFNRQKLIILFTSILVVIFLWLGKSISIYYYAILLLVTMIMSFTIHLFFLKKINFKYSMSYDINNSEFKGMLRLFIPTLLSTGVYQVSLLIDTMISARLGPGSISILSYANSVISMINLLFLRNLTSFIYPRLVKKPTEIERQESLTDYILVINTMMCLIILLFISVGQEGISFLFERGKFTNEHTNLVFICALIYTISLPTNGIRDLIYRYFYINRDTLSPFINSIMISALNIIVSLILVNYIGLYGVILGTVIASYFSLLFISLKFGRKFQLHFNKNTFFIENLKVILSTLITAIILIFTSNLLIIENMIINVIVYTVIAIVIYLTLLKSFQSKIFRVKL